MAISLKDFEKTEYVGVYISKDSIHNKGNRYLGRFQYNGKKYMKILGYSIRDNLDTKLANELLQEYKSIVLKDDYDNTNIQIPQKDSYIVIDDEPIKLDDIIQEYKVMKDIVGDYLPILDDTSYLSCGIQKIYENEVLKQYQTELIKLQNHLEETNKKMIVVFEGRDASGKGSAIRRITRYMNNKHYRIVALGKPTDNQKTQWFFKRYIEQFPKNGEMVIFDRSWYSRAMVEPVFGFCTDKQYESFMADVGDFEKDLIRQDIVLIKIFLSVSKEEQQKRLEKRKNDPLRQWRLSQIDLQSIELWDKVTQKKQKMLKNTNFDYAKWHIIKSDNKHLARLEAIKVILNSINYEDKNTKLSFEYDNNVYVSVEDEVKNDLH